VPFLDAQIDIMAKLVVAAVVETVVICQ
jgi:hypothetical protein